MRNIKHIIEIARKANVHLALWGLHGIGKTEAVDQLKEHDNSYVETIILSQEDESLFKGYPYTKVDEKGRHLTKYAMQDWLARLWDAHDDGRKTVLFLDEMNRGSEEVRNAAMNFLTTGRLGEHKLPPGTFIVCAMNPETDGDFGVHSLSDPFVSRFCHVPVKVDASAWLSWARSKGVNGKVVEFIAKDETNLHNIAFDFQEAVGNRIRPNPRSVVAVSRIMDVFKENYKSREFDAYALPMIAGLIGDTMSLAFRSSLYGDAEALFTCEEMLDPSPDTIRRVRELGELHKTEVLNASLMAFREYCPKNSVGFSNLAHFVEKFLNNCPRDIAVGFLQGGEGEIRTYWNQVKIFLPEELLEAYINSINVAYVQPKKFNEVDLTNTVTLNTNPITIGAVASDEESE